MFFSSLLGQLCVQSKHLHFTTAVTRSEQPVSVDQIITSVILASSSSLIVLK